MTRSDYTPIARPLLSVGLLLLAASLSACNADEGVAPDSEFGVLDGKSDGVGPTAQEAQVIVALVNQELADNDSGDNFVALLDSRLHRTAARNIGAARAGADGQYGTSDDALFADIVDVDRVRYVGPVAMSQLYELAIDEGYATPDPVPVNIDCGEALGMIGSEVVLEEIEQLQIIRDSGCTVFNGGVRVSFDQAFLPSSQKHLFELPSVREVHGRIWQLGTKHDVTFSGLTYAKRILKDDYSGSYPVLETVGELDIDCVKFCGSGFPSLKEANVIRIEVKDKVVGFRALEKVGTLEIDRQVHFDADFLGDFKIDAFDSLTRVDLLVLDGANRYRDRWNGAFDALESVGEFDAVYFDAHDLEFPALTRIDGNLTLDQVNWVFDPFTELESIGGSLEVTEPGDDHLLGRYETPPNLHTIGSNLRFTGDYLMRFIGSDALTTVGGGISIMGFASEVRGFDGLESVSSIFIRARRAYTYDSSAEVTGFEALIEVSGRVDIASSDWGYGEDLMPDLEFIGGTADFSLGASGSEVLGSLEYVGAHMTISGANRGFNALGTVEGNLTIRDSLESSSLFGGRPWQGLESLTGVGGDLSVDNDIDDYDVQRIVDQLVAFTGEIIVIN